MTGGFLQEAEPGKNYLFHNARIYTQDKSHPFYQAMAVMNGRIVWLGMEDDLYHLPSEKFEIIDLLGKTVLPSFCDAHMHFVFWALSLARVDLRGCKTYQEALNRLEKRAKELKKNEWLVGQGWHKDSWKKSVWPHKKDLDKIAPHNPAAVFSYDEHSLWANSLALKKAGIDSKTENPQGGEIVRDDSGEATGILKETAMGLVHDIVPGKSEKTAMKLIAEAQQKLHTLGITSLGGFDSIDGFGLMQKYHLERGLKVRIGQNIQARHLEHVAELNLRTGLGDDRLWINGIKFFADGALGSQTAWMHKPYNGSKRNTGIQVFREDELLQKYRQCVRSGLNIVTHAIGDKANTVVLENIIRATGRRKKSFRHRIEHCQLLRKSDIPRFAKNSIIASVQPCQIIPDIPLIPKYWGQRGRYAYAFRSLLESGAMLAFGSDAPILPPDPLWNIYCAVNRRKNSRSKAFYSSESLNVEQAVYAHTFGGAYAMGAEDRFGSITIGKYADIVILEKDIHTIDPGSIPGIKIVATLMEGEFLYGRENFEEW